MPETITVESPFRADLEIIRDGEKVFANLSLQNVSDCDAYIDTNKIGGECFGEEVFFLTPYYCEGGNLTFTPCMSSPQPETPEHSLIKPGEIINTTTELTKYYDFCEREYDRISFIYSCRMGLLDSDMKQVMQMNNYGKMQPVEFYVASNRVVLMGDAVKPVAVDVLKYNKIPDLLARIGTDSYIGYFGELVSCETIYANGEKQTDESIAEVHIVLKDDGRLECELIHENPNHPYDYWSFKLQGLRKDKDVWRAKAANVSFEANRWAYIDDDASGSYTYDEKEGVETLDMTIHLYGSPQRQIIRWKTPVKQIAGKSYRAAIAQTKKRGTMIDIYRQLRFDRDTLTVTEYSLNRASGAAAVMSERRHKWEITDDGMAIFDPEAHSTEMRQVFYTAYRILNTRLIEWEATGECYKNPDPYDPRELRVIERIVYDRITDPSDIFQTDPKLRP